MLKIQDIIQGVIPGVIELAKSSNEAKLSFELWMKTGQQNPNFDCPLKISSADISLVQFCLEAILREGIKICLKNFISEKYNPADLDPIIFERDFYSWISGLEQPKHDIILSLANNIKIENEGFLNELYEFLFESAGRKNHGQHFTDPNLARFIVSQANHKLGGGKNYLLDPACGAGIFLSVMIDKFSVDNCEVVGIDRNYFSCFMSRAVYTMKFIEKTSSIPKFIPVFWIDFLTNYGSDVNNNINHIGPYSKQDATAREYLSEMYSSKLSLVVGNPPYVRIQNLCKEKKEEYKSRFNTASGRFDLYMLFIEHAINNTKKGGKISLICSNKFMTTSAGKGLRDKIARNCSIEKIIDFTDTEMFSAMVLPCIIVLHNRVDRSHKMRCIVLSRMHKTGETKRLNGGLWEFLNEAVITDIDLNLIVKDLRRPKIHLSSFTGSQPDTPEVWHLIPGAVRQVCEKIKTSSTLLLGDIASIKVGIKTTCDKAFVFKGGHPFRESESQRYIHPLLTTSDIKKWRVSPTFSSFLLYPYDYDGENLTPLLLDKHKEIKQHLESHREVLQSRTYVSEAGRAWYEIWVPHRPTEFEVEAKIVTPDISTGNRFAIDFSKAYCQGTCYNIKLNNPQIDDYYYLLGILNSQLIEFYHKTTLSTTLYAKRHRYWTAHLSKYPIVNARTQSPDAFKQIVELSRKLVNGDKVDMEEKMINHLIYSLYNIDGDDIKLIQNQLQFL